MKETLQKCFLLTQNTAKEIFISNLEQHHELICRNSKFYLSFTATTIEAQVYPAKAQNRAENPLNPLVNMLPLEAQVYRAAKTQNPVESPWTGLYSVLCKTASQDTLELGLNQILTSINHIIKINMFEIGQKNIY